MSAYDSIADEYDRQLEADAWMRRVLWNRYVDAFSPGRHVLDAGCGTGTDAVFLAQQGVRVTAIDISPGMVAVARSKAIQYGVTDLVQVEQRDIDDLSRLRGGELDGIISSFAALNTLPSLTRFAADASRLLQPRGRLILHLLNRSSLWEYAGLAARGRWAEARRLGDRQERAFEVGGERVVHYMSRADEVYRRYFASGFRLCYAGGLGIVRPPRAIPYLSEAALEALGRLDALIGRYRPFLDWGRFVVLDMERNPG